MTLYQNIFTVTRFLSINQFREFKIIQVDKQLYFIINNNIITLVKDCPTDFTLVLDSSGSIGELNWWKQKQFVIDFLSIFKIC